MPTEVSNTDQRDVTLGDALLEQLRAELRHTPGLALTPAQAARLFNLAPETCERLIAALASEGSVQLRADGRIVSTLRA
jgi:hypothetical protein